MTEAVCPTTTLVVLRQHKSHFNNVSQPSSVIFTIEDTQESKYGLTHEEYIIHYINMAFKYHRKTFYFGTRASIDLYTLTFAFTVIKLYISIWSKMKHIFGALEFYFL